MAKKTLLIIEGEKILLKALNLALLGNNFSIVSATGGRAGLAMIRKKRPDLILLDLLLPHMNGFEVLQAVRKDPAIAKTHVIVLSNLAHEADRKKAKALGVKEYYVKSSADLAKLSRRIRHILA